MRVKTEEKKGKMAKEIERKEKKWKRKIQKKTIRGRNSGKGKKKINKN